MKVLLINSVCGFGSTGRICTDLADLLQKEGHECCIAYGRGKVPSKFAIQTYKICGPIGVAFDCLKSRLFDNAGFNNRFSTKRFVKWISSYKPDIVHIHNLHGYYVNIKILIDYLKKENIKVIFSLYDCWLLTGHCAHFDACGCLQMCNGCPKCNFKHLYPKAYFSKSSKNFARKVDIFSNLTNAHFIYPSSWMSSVASLSILKNYDFSIIPNGIDLSKFVGNKSKFSISTDKKKILLGVSNIWTDSKGLSYFNRLADILPSDYLLCLVGKVRKNKKVNSRIKLISRIKNLEDLNDLYSNAYLFLNFTLEETQGLTTIEAFACGVPAIVFSSGGAGECVRPENGFLVEKGDLGTVYSLIKTVDFNSKFNSEVIRDSVSSYDKLVTNRRIIELYCRILGI